MAANILSGLDPIAPLVNKSDSARLTTVSRILKNMRKKYANAAWWRRKGGREFTTPKVASLQNRTWRSILTGPTNRQMWVEPLDFGRKPLVWSRVGPLSGSCNPLLCEIAEKSI